MIDNKVVRKTGPVTKDKAKALIASGLQRAVMNHGLEDVAAAATCSPRCLQKALSHETLPEAHTLANILLLEPTVLSEFYSHLGFKIVPTHAAADQDMQTVAEMSRAVTVFLQALEDGRRCHRETLEIASLLRPLVQKLTAIVHEADGLRSVA